MKKKSNFYNDSYLQRSCVFRQTNGKSPFVYDRIILKCLVATKNASAKLQGEGNVSPKTGLCLKERSGEIQEGSRKYHCIHSRIRSSRANESTSSCSRVKTKPRVRTRPAHTAHIEAARVRNGCAGTYGGPGVYVYVCLRVFAFRLLWLGVRGHLRFRFRD